MLKWYALHVRPKQEFAVAGALRSKGLEVFLPCFRMESRWSDRLKTSESPFFPSYMFCRFDAGGRILPILTTPGVRGIVGTGKLPVAIPDEEIADLQTACASGLRIHRCPYLAVGDVVVVEQGPLRGLEGTILLEGNKSRLVISMSLLQRSVSVEIERSWARPLRAAVRGHFVSGRNS